MCYEADRDKCECIIKQALTADCRFIAVLRGHFMRQKNIENKILRKNYLLRICFDNIEKKKEKKEQSEIISITSFIQIFGDIF